MQTIKVFKNLTHRETLAKFGSFLLFFLLSACSDQDPEEKLHELIRSSNFSVPVVLLEMRGGFYTNSWFGGVVYYGYSGDGNYKNCLKDAEIRNKSEGMENYRCRTIE